MDEEYPQEYSEDDLATQEYEDQIEEQTEDQYELGQEVAEDYSSGYQPKDDLYSLFWKVVRLDSSSKVGNLDKTELGMLDISVRDCQRIALLAITLKHPGFARFFAKQAELILATSASKAGWLPELFVSQRKLTTKTKKTEPKFPIQQPQKKKGFLSGK